MLNTETGCPTTAEIRLFSRPNLGSNRSTQPNARGKTGTKMESQARTSTRFRPGISVRAINQTNTRAIGNEIAVLVTESARLFHNAPMAEGSPKAACQFARPYLNDWPAGATLTLFTRSMPSGNTRMMPTRRGRPREARRLASEPSSIGAERENACAVTAAIGALLSLPVWRRRFRPDEHRWIPLSWTRRCSYRASDGSDRG